MELTTKQKKVIKALLEKELEGVRAGKILLINSPFLNRIAADTDVEFLKNEAMYLKFLEELLKQF